MPYGEIKVILVLCSAGATDYSRRFIDCIEGAGLTALSAVVSVREPYVALHCDIRRYRLPSRLRRRPRARNERCAPSHRGCPGRGCDGEYLPRLVRGTGRHRARRKASRCTRVHARSTGRDASQTPRGRGARRGTAHRWAGVRDAGSGCQCPWRHYHTRHSAELARTAGIGLSVERITRRFLITGKVQGVYFHHSTRLEAERLAIRGVARNLPDGSVEVIAQGTPAAVASLREWLHRGPKHARVAGVRELDASTDEIDTAPSASFSVQ